MKLKIDAKNNLLYLLEASTIEIKALKNYLNRHAKNFRFDKRFKLGIWDGKINHYKGDGRIPLGLWKEVLRCCQELGYPFIIDNKEDFPLNRQMDKEMFMDWVKEFFKDRKNKDGDAFFPRDYQISTAYSILKNRYCLAEIATAGGKSLTFSMVALYLLQRRPKTKILLVVPSITLVTQFYDDLFEYNHGLHRENKQPINLDVVEIMGDKPRTPQSGREPNVYIGTYQSLVKYPKDWFEQFDVLAMDEAHTVKAKSMQTIAKACKRAYYRFGMSGTFPGRETAEILTIMSVTGPIIDKVKAAFLMDKGVISKVIIKALILDHQDPEFHDKVINVRKIDGKNALDIEKNRVQNSANRINLIVKILRASKHNTMVLFQNKAHGKLIYEEAKKYNENVYYIDGDVRKDDRNAIKAYMEDTSSVKWLIASYGTLSTGVSIRAIANVVLADSFKSESRVLQSIGRALRLHLEKEVATIFDLIDVFDSDPKKKRNILYGQWVERKMMYAREKYPVEEKKINI
jgi:superfamily II DNA or RNA helicase